MESDYWTMIRKLYGWFPLQDVGVGSSLELLQGMKDEFQNSRVQTRTYSLPAPSHCLYQFLPSVLPPGEGS